MSVLLTYITPNQSTTRLSVRIRLLSRLAERVLKCFFYPRYEMRKRGPLLSPRVCPQWRSQKLCAGAGQGAYHTLPSPSFPIPALPSPPLP